MLSKGEKQNPERIQKSSYSYINVRWSKDKGKRFTFSGKDNRGWIYWLVDYLTENRKVQLESVQQNLVYLVGTFLRCEIVSWFGDWTGNPNERANNTQTITSKLGIEVFFHWVLDKWSKANNGDQEINHLLNMLLNMPGNCEWKTKRSDHLPHKVTWSTSPFTFGAPVRPKSQSVTLHNIRRTWAPWGVHELWRKYLRRIKGKFGVW